MSRAWPCGLNTDRVVHALGPANGIVDRKGRLPPFVSISAWNATPAPTYRGGRKHGVVDHAFHEGQLALGLYETRAGLATAASAGCRAALRSGGVYRTQHHAARGQQRRRRGRRRKCKYG